MDGARLTLISIPNGLRLHTPLTVVPASHLYLGGQRKSIAGLTPHPSASGSCHYVTHTHTHTPLRLHVLREMAQSPVVGHTRRHGGTRVRIFSHLRIPLSATPTSGSFSPPLHHVSDYSFYSGTPYLHRHPTPTSDPDPPPRLT